jgi:hypothetical protein
MIRSPIIYPQSSLVGLQLIYFNIFHVQSPRKFGGAEHNGPHFVAIWEIALTGISEWPPRRPPCKRFVINT